VFSVLRYLDFEGQQLFNRLSLVVFFWDCPPLKFVVLSNSSLVPFLDSFHENASFCLRSLSGSSVVTLNKSIGSFFRPWLFGRLILQDFIASPYYVHIDADVWIVKPWLGPLARSLSLPNQRHKLYFGGWDSGLMESKNVAILEGLGIPPESYINAGFFVVRNVPSAHARMATAIEILRKNPDLPWFEQTALNLAFGGGSMALLPREFEKGYYRVCKRWTINCHGVLPAIENEAQIAMDRAYQGWRNGPIP
jgi:hypothetical protein